VSHREGRCRVCGTAENLVQQPCPSDSGPGWTETVCTLCIRLPADPEYVSDAMTDVLMRIAGVDR
jgi:hypothetical protein